MYISSLEIYKSNVKIKLFSGFGKFFSKKQRFSQRPARIFFVSSQANQSISI